MCALERKPYILLDVKKILGPAEAADDVLKFEENAIQVLNVAGPRLSGWAAGYAFALAVIGETIRRSREGLQF